MRGFSRAIPFSHEPSNFCKKSRDLQPLKASPRNFQLLVATCTASYLEGQGDLVSGLIMGIIGVTIWAIGVANLLTKSP